MKEKIKQLRKLGDALAQEKCRPTPRATVLHLIILIVGAALLNIAPDGISKLLPEVSQEVSNQEIVLGKVDEPSEDKVALLDQHGNPIQCDRESFELIATWKCETGKVSTIAVETTDPNLSLQRMIRAAYKTPLPEVEATKNENMWELNLTEKQVSQLTNGQIDTPISAFAIDGFSNDPEDTTMIIAIVSCDSELRTDVINTLEGAAK